MKYIERERSKVIGDKRYRMYMSELKRESLGTGLGWFDSGQAWLADFKGYSEDNMQRWEYKTVIAAGEHMGSPDAVIQLQLIDGDRKTPVIKETKGKGLFGSDNLERISLEAFLKSAGRDGWEVTGLTPIEVTGGSNVKLAFLLLMKRPLEEE
jgi:hypothetical protein